MEGRHLPGCIISSRYHSPVSRGGDSGLGMGGEADGCVRRCIWTAAPRSQHLRVQGQQRRKTKMTSSLRPKAVRVGFSKHHQAMSGEFHAQHCENQLQMLSDLNLICRHAIFWKSCHFPCVCGGSPCMERFAVHDDRAFVGAADSQWKFGNSRGLPQNITSARGQLVAHDVRSAFCLTCLLPPATWTCFCRANHFNGILGVISQSRPNK